MSREKNCYCHTCKREFHYLGVARHRAMHRDKKQNCIITLGTGETYTFKFGDQK